MEYTRKIFVDTNPFGHKAYADYLSLTGEPDSPTFLFFGGSISPSRYHLREVGYPENLFSYFREACQTNGLASANLLTIPCPYGTIDDGFFLDGMSELLTQFFSRIELKIRHVNGIIGNSKGCYWSVGLLGSFSNVKKLVTIAGASMRIADSEAQNVSYPDIHCFSNNQDYLRQNTIGYIEWLKEKNVTASLTSRDGDHDFCDYEANGSVQEAFKLATSV